MKRISQAEFLERVTPRLKGSIDLSRFVYVNSPGKSVAICPEHGEFLVSANALMNGIGCPACALISRVGKRRKGVDEFIKQAQHKHGTKYDYSGIEYKNALTPVKIICPQHGEFKQSPGSHLSGRGCPNCGSIAIGDKSRMSQSDFIARCKKRHGDKYDLSRVAYKRQGDKVEVVCKEHGAFFPAAGNFMTGSGCPSCGRSKVGLKSRRSFESYVEEATQVHSGKFSYKALGYAGGTPYLSIVCPTHGEFSQRAACHLKGVGCSKCSKKVRDTGSFIEEAKKVHKSKYGYEKAKFKGAFTKVTITCPTHGEFQQAPNYHVNHENGCPRCGKVGPSQGQIAVFDFIKQFTEAEMEVQIKESRLRYDILLTNHNLAIEYHGLIWHSTKFTTDPKRDFKKHKSAEASGVRIIHIYEDEWENRQAAVKALLLSAVGALPKIGARSLCVCEIDKSEAVLFLEKYHIQGSSQSSVFLGLRNGDTLVACMGFSVAKSIRGNKNKRLWELQRYATSLMVVGGASKLLKAFIGMGVCDSLVSYSDNRLFTGKMYEKTGFSLDGQVAPDYVYVTTSKATGRLHKSLFQRKFLGKRLKSFDPSKSEVQNCFENGFYQLFDCGKKRWVLTCK